MVKQFLTPYTCSRILKLTGNSSNLLYPKEDRITNTLMFACRTCQFSEPATSSCVFRNHLYNTVGETAGVTQDVGTDPTVCLPGCCLLCGQVIRCYFCGDTACTQFRGREVEEYKTETPTREEDCEAREDQADDKIKEDSFVEHTGEDHMQQILHLTQGHSRIMY